MTFSQILDIAIVLVAVYATLSCVCSWVHEKIAKFLELRGWNLFRGILQLTGDHDLAADIFNHPLVATTSPDPTKKVDSKDGSGKISGIAQYSSVRASKPPSYLDARNFSSAFWHQVLVYPSSVIAKKAAAALAAAKKPPTPDAQDGAEPAPAEAGTAATGGGGTVDPMESLVKQALAAPTALIDALQTSAKDLPDPLKRQAVTLLAQAGGDYDKLLRATDGWFNAQMDRVSGWYKRQTAWFMMGIAALVVSFTGVDTIEILQTLSTLSPQQLSQTSQAAFDNASRLDPAKHATGPAAVKPTAKPTTKPSASASAPPLAATQGADSSANPDSSSTPVPGKLVKDGYDVTKFFHPVTNPVTTWTCEPQPPATDCSGLSKHAPGRALTFFALLLGGPFWFSLLMQLANVRNAGRKPKRSDQPPT